MGNPIYFSLYTQFEDKKIKLLKHDIGKKQLFKLNMKVCGGPSKHTVVVICWSAAARQISNVLTLAFIVPEKMSLRRAEGSDAALKLKT